jgi:hypothetical protein
VECWGMRGSRVHRGPTTSAGGALPHPMPVRVVVWGGRGRRYEEGAVLTVLTMNVMQQHPRTTNCGP